MMSLYVRAHARVLLLCMRAGGVLRYHGGGEHRARDWKRPRERCPRSSPRGVYEYDIYIILCMMDFLHGWCTCMVLPTAAVYIYIYMLMVRDDAIILLIEDIYMHDVLSSWCNCMVLPTTTTYCCIYIYILC